MKRILQFIGFIATLPLIILLSLLPFPILYLISDFLYLILYYVIRFRREVVRKNLAIAFPEKTEEERKRIEKAFYRHLSDLFMEMIKTTTISQQNLNKHLFIENPEVLNDLYDEGRSVILYGGHQGNWEWISGVGLQLKHKSMAIYKRLSNPFFEKWLLKNRSKFNFDLVPTYLAKEYIDKKEKAGEKIAYGFLGDQNPLPHKAKLWLPFFGKEVPVLTGAEEIARKYNIPVVFFEMKKIKRGYYTVELFLLNKNPEKTEEFEITREYFKRLEELIKKQPAYYYWIHRRFKHTRS